MGGDLRTRLSTVAEALGLTLEASQIDVLHGYLGLLSKWSKVYNLTAVRDPALMLTQHVSDCLAVVPALRRQLALTPWGRVQGLRVLDVGAGAGLPGVVLAACCPQLQVDCVDAVGKKAAFVQQVALALKLAHLRGVHARVEDLPGPYDLATCRAFATLKDFTGWSAHALAPHGIWMAMKGKVPDAEMDALPDSVQVFHVEPLLVPELQAQRCLVWMRPRAANQDRHAEVT